MAGGSLKDSICRTNSKGVVPGYNFAKLIEIKDEKVLKVFRCEFNRVDNISVIPRMFSIKCDDDCWNLKSTEVSAILGQTHFVVFTKSED